jgi:glycerol-3-phosphate dehydrogenase subunit B
MFYDVIVIGAGLSGLMAADAAQSGGARVLLLAKGMGSLPLTSGCIDGLGYLPASEKPVGSPLALAKGLPTHHSQHPYAKLGTEKILSAFSRFQEICRAGGLEYAGDFTSTVLLPTSLGTFHPTCLVPETMKKGDLCLEGRALLLGFRGLRDFFPDFAAENLNALAARGQTLCSFRAGSLDGVGVPGKAVNAMNLARAFDRKDFRDSFAARAKPLLNKGERLGVPAVLGFHSPKKAWQDLQEKLDAEIFEVAMPPPAVPGVRLYNALKDYLRERGVRVVVGLPGLMPISEPGRIWGFSVGTSATGPVYRADSFVLATGKFFGGGLDSDRATVRETLLDLPVHQTPTRKEWFKPRLLTPEGQPFNSFGVEVDEKLRPTDSSGRVLFENLFAAGGILAHADSMAEKSGGGVAISTGHWAGKMAAGFIESNISNATSAHSYRIPPGSKGGRGGI